MTTYIKEFFATRCPLPPMVRRLGLAGFLFFLIKGLLWLTVPTLLLMLNQ